VSGSGPFYQTDAFENLLEPWPMNFPPCPTKSILFLKSDIDMSPTGPVKIADPEATRIGPRRCATQEFN
jgi:hypothetical protein